MGIETARVCRLGHRVNESQQEAAWMLKAEIEVEIAPLLIELQETHGSFANHCLAISDWFLRTFESRLRGVTMVAGSASFPLRGGPEACQQNAPHLSYKFAMNRDVVDRVRCRTLPEIHVWSICTFDGELWWTVDPTTGFVGINARSLLKLDNERSHPNVFVGGIGDMQDEGYLYIQDEQATILALALTGRVGLDREAGINRWLAYAEKRYP